jgi:hypothetical protein
MSNTTAADRRPTRITAGILAVLVLLVIVSNVLWPGSGPADPTQRRFPADTSPFPQLPMGPVLHVVPLDPAANESMRFLMVSLQGLVNRVQVELYLDPGDPGENVSATLAEWEERYGIVYDSLDATAALDLYAPRANGTIVYDPSRPESVNIGTVIAGQRGALLTGPDLAGWLDARYGLPVLFEYATSDWAALDRIGAYDRALRDLYPASNAALLAILPPDRWAIRDYLVATRTFVFYLPQGMLASPFDVAATTRILRAAPRGIPVLGWFDSPTLTEENAFVQLLSREGKFIVGAWSVPNLSVMTALGRGRPHGQVPAPAVGDPENKTYVVLGISDGDNLDFVHGRMRELWAEPARGTRPIAWSLNPLLVELAPPLLDAYYDTATPGDRFIAAPSGAGYLYPDYASREDLSSFLSFSRRYVEAADMDVVWLLNAYPASEVPYSDASLSAYVDGLAPHGLVLDYADQPRTRDAWIQAGSRDVAPVVRSTHFWTTADNALAKIGAAAATWDAVPHFLWLTLYTFRFDLAHALDLLRILDGRLPGGVEVVGPETFFTLLRRGFLREATEGLRSAESDPIASVVFRGEMDSARRHLLEADVHFQAGDADRAAAAAFLGLEALRGIRAAEALLLSLLVLLGAGVLAVLAQRGRRTRLTPTGTVRLEPLIFVVAAVALFMFALREAVQQNFWTYPTILVGWVVAAVHRPLRILLDRAWGIRAPAIAALLALIFDALAIRTSAAFPLALIGTLLALEAYLVRCPATSLEIVAGLSFGVAIGFVGGFDLPTLTVVALLLVAPAVRLRAAPPLEAAGVSARAALPGILLLLPLSALAVAFSYSLALRLEVQGDSLRFLAAVFLVVPPSLAILLRRIVPSAPNRRAMVLGLGGAAAFGAAVLAVTGTVPATFALLGLFVSLSYAALAGVRRPADRGAEGRSALKIAVWLLPGLILFLQIPPILYSLTLVPLPEAVEYVLYAPTALIAATSLALALLIGLRGRFRTDVGKHYPPEPDGRTGGS